MHTDWEEEMYKELEEENTGDDEVFYGMFVSKNPLLVEAGFVESMLMTQIYLEGFVLIQPIAYNNRATQKLYRKGRELNLKLF